MILKQGSDRTIYEHMICYGDLEGIKHYQRIGILRL